MAIDGFYNAYMTGASGQGFVFFVFINGKLVGSDPLGVTFDGHYALQSDGSHLGEVNVHVPPGGTVIQGASAGPEGLNYSVEISLPSDFAVLPFIEVGTPLGKVNVRLTKVRDWPADA